MSHNRVCWHNLCCPHALAGVSDNQAIRLSPRRETRKVSAASGRHGRRRRLDKMSMERWEPLRDMMSLRDAMERLIQESFLRPAGSILPAMRGAMPLDVIERGDAYEIRASLPGIKPEDVQITVQGDVLTIRGATTSEQEHKDDRDDENWILHERR